MLFYDLQILQIFDLQIYGFTIDRIAHQPRVIARRHDEVEAYCIRLYGNFLSRQRE